MLAWLFGSFAILLGVGLPIAVCLGLAAILALVMTGSGVPIIVAAQTMFDGVNSYSLMAIPFFILCGNMMSGGGLSKKLVDFIKIFFGKIKGGLSLVTIASSMFFAAISGSCPATTAAIGGVMVPEMDKSGYDKRFSAATAAAGGIVGQIIPPSIPMVTYAVLAEVSVSTLFLTGIGPGILLGLLMMAYAYYHSKKNDVPVLDMKINREVIWKSFKEGIWALIMPAIILGGIYSGLFTPTEAGAIAAVYGFLVGMFVYKSLTLKKIMKVFVDTAVASSVIMLIMGTVATFNYVLTVGQIPQIIANSLLSLTTNKVIILLLFNIVVLIAGMFMSSSAAIALLTPILLPILIAIGINPYQVGIIFIVNMGIGMITPPVGNCLYVACNIANIKFEPLVKATMPYVVVSVIGLILITFIEPISMFLVYFTGAM